MQRIAAAVVEQTEIGKQPRSEPVLNADFKVIEGFGLDVVPIRGTQTEEPPVLVEDGRVDAAVVVGAGILGGEAGVAVLSDESGLGTPIDSRTDHSSCSVNPPKG